MATPEPSSILIVGVTLGSILGASALGIPVFTVFLGMGCMLLGMLVKVGTDAQRGLEAGTPIKWAALLGWLLGGLITAPGISFGWIVALHTMGVQADGAVAAGLWVFGFGGSKAGSYLFSLLSNLQKGVLPKGQPPENGG